MTKVQLMIDGLHGVYLPQMFAKSYNEDERWIGADASDINKLLSGPDHPEYWEAWEYVLDKAHYMDKDGRDWKLWLEGDLFCYTGNGEQWT